MRFPDVCKGCEERSGTCHTTCERYRTAKAAHDEELEKDLKKKMGQWDINNFRLDMAARAARKKRQRQSMKK